MEKERREKLYKKIILGILGFFAFYIFFSGYVPPLVRQSVGEVQAETGATNGENIALVDDNQTALIYRLRLIESAKEEIYLSTYSFYDDESGNDVMCALYAAALRGVKIKIIIDGFTAGKVKNTAAFRALLSVGNVEAKEYNPVGIGDFWRSNFRLHDKYLTADRKAYILGGRNIGDLFLGNYQAKQNIDRDVLVLSAEEYAVGENSSIDEVKGYFDDIWKLSQNKAFSGKLSKKKREKAQNLLAERYAALKGKYPEIVSPIDRESETIQTEGVKLLHGEIAPSTKSPILWKTLVKSMQGQDTIIQTPYVIMDHEMYADLSFAAKKGGAIEIITNSVQSGANPWGCADYLNEKKEILETGAKITEINGEKSSHVKTVLIGNNLSFIGSFNLDMRSTYLNTETVLVIDCPALNETLRENIEGIKASSATYAMGEDKKIAEEKGENYTAKKTGFFKKILYFILRFVLIPFRHLL